MKKILSLMLALILALSVATTQTYAKEKYKGLPPEIAKKFKDLDNHWAEKYIEKMAKKGVVKGYKEGIFAPSRSVTKLESIIMALRVMGYEEEAGDYLVKIKIGKKKLKLKDFVAEWSYGYVKLALEKGILDEYEIRNLKLNEPAKRHEVARYLIRAVSNDNNGYEEIVEEHMKDDLRFTDAPAIPSGAVGYVYLAHRLELITGYPDKTFRPNSPVTRAEMAVMVSRLDDKIDNNEDDEKRFREYQGEVKDIDNDYDWIKIQVGSRDKYFKISDDVKVEFDDEDGDIEDIKVGDEVEVKINEDNEIVYIEVERELEYRKHDGRVADIDDDKFSIISSKALRVFDIDSDLLVRFEDEDGELEDLEIGDEVEVIVDEDDEIRYIIVERDIESDSVTGELVDIYEDDDQIVVKSETKFNVYTLDRNIKVFLNTDEVELDDLKEDDKLNLEIDDKKVVVIRGYRIN